MVISVQRVALCILLVTGVNVAPALQAEEGAGKSARLEPLFQQLFLGELVYPQDQGGIQFTTGFLTAAETKHESQLSVVVEYGITDRFQVAIEVPSDFERLQGTGGVGNIELEGFWNFYSDAQAGWAAGVGFGLGLPSASSEVGDRAMLYQPFVAACRQFDTLGFNASAGLEVKDFLDSGQEPELRGAFALAAFRSFERFVPLLELSVELEEWETPVRLAPGVLWRPAGPSAEVGLSFPIGLHDAPDVALFLMATIEFQPRRRTSANDGDDASGNSRPQGRLTSPTAEMSRREAFGEQ
jgi:hypothetical protein